MSQENGSKPLGRKRKGTAIVSPRGPGKYQLKINIPTTLRVPGGKATVTKVIDPEDDDDLAYQAKRFHDEELEKLRRNPRLAVSPKGTVNDLLDQWLVMMEGDPDTWTASTVTNYQRYADRYVRPHIGRRKPMDITGDRLERMYADIRRDPDNDAGASTIEHVHGVVSKCFGWAWESSARRDKWRLASNPAVDARTPTSARRRDLPSVAYKAVVDLIDDRYEPRNLVTAWRDPDGRLRSETHGPDPARTRWRPYWVILRVAAATGLRRGELCGLQWRDLDLEGHGARGVVHVRQAVSLAKFDGKHQPYVKAPKNGRTRIVPLDSTTANMLRAWRQFVDEARAARDAGPVTGSTYVFGMAPKGKHSGVWQNWQGTHPMRPDTLTGIWGRTVEGTTLADLRLHDVRHLWISEMLRRTADLALVSKVAGHSTPAFTASRYSHALPGGEDGLVRAMDAARLGTPVHMPVEDDDPL